MTLLATLVSSRSAACNLLRITKVLPKPSQLSSTPWGKARAFVID